MKGKTLFSSILGLTILGSDSFAVFAKSEGYIKLSEIQNLRGLKQIIQTQAIRSETSREPRIERAILRQIPKELVKEVRYHYNRIDLNGDNIPEVIVQIVGQGICGSGGCSTFIYKIVGQYQLVSEIAQTGGPVIVTAQKSYGWNDLIVRSGSVLEPGYRLMRFNGRSYPASPADGLINLGKLGQLLKLPESSNPVSTQQAGRKLEYIITIKQKLEDIAREFKAKNYEEITNINLEIANATITLLDPDDPTLVRSAQAIAIRSEAIKLRDLCIFLKRRELTDALDGFDKFYLIVAGVSSAVKISTSTVTFITPARQANTRILADKVDAINTVLFDGFQISYREDFRRQYERLKVNTNLLQERISGLSSSIDFSSQEVGQYLINNRKDVVTQRPDGTIAISVDGVLYPP